MSKRTIRITTALALVAVMSMVAVSLLMTGAGGATAFNADASARAMPTQYTEQCSNGIAVPNPTDNPALVSDCAALLASKPTLEGTTGNLNWSANRAISRWSGVTIEHNRVTRLSLPNRSLNGAIPSELGNLASLEALDLSDNILSGVIPSELGNLANLERSDGLRLHGNQFTGCIPQSLCAPLGSAEIRRLGLPICVAAPTPASTSTPTPTATHVSYDALLTRLIALETRLAELADLKNQVSILATRVANLENGSGVGAPPATPTATPVPPTTTPVPTATPEPPTVTSEPTATSTPIPCSEIGPGADLSGCEFNSVDWSERNLANANLTGAIITNSNLRKAILTSANLTNANLKQSDMTDAILTGANISGADITETKFTRANMDSVNLTDTRIRATSNSKKNNATKFRAAILTNVDFNEGINLSGVGFINADLSGSSLVNAVLEDADLRSATMDKTDLSGATLEDTKINKVDLTSVIVDTKTKFIKADMTGVDLTKVSWERVDFDSSNLKDAIMNDATFENCKFDDVDFDGATLDDAKFPNSDFPGADFQNASLNDAEFDDADMEGAKNMRQAGDIEEVDWDDTTCPDGTNSDDAISGGCYPDHLDPDVTLASAPAPCTEIGPGADLIGCEFNSVDWSERNLANANLTGAIITNSNLRKAILTSANLTNANLKQSDMTDAILTGANISGADITETKFTRANMDSVNLTDTRIRATSNSKKNNATKFRAAILTNVDFNEGINLSGVGFINADLSGSSLVNAVLEDADLRSATMDKTDLSGATLEDTKINKVDLTSVIVDTKTQFIKANMTGVDLTKVSWERVDFDSSNLKDAIMNDATFENCKFDDVDFNGATLDDAKFPNSDFPGADFRNASVNDAEFDDADMEGAKNMRQARDIEEVDWDDTTCPDGTSSDDAVSGGCYPDHLVPNATPVPTPTSS